MSDERDVERESTRPLVEISDLLGLREPLSELFRAISRGCGELLEPFLRRLRAKADIDVLRAWKAELAAAPRLPDRIELDLEGRSVLRVRFDDLRRQTNRERVAIGAIEELRFEADRGPASPGEGPRMEDEWIDRFWRLAQDVSNQDLQRLWSRVLAREARRVGSFSLKTLEVLSLLTPSDARELEHLARCTCSTSSARGQHALVVLSLSASRPHGADGKFRPEDVAEVSRRLVEIVGPLSPDHFGPLGIFRDTGWAGNLPMLLDDRGAALRIGTRHFRIRGFTTAASSAEKVDGDVVYVFSGKEWSRVGREILSLIDTDPDVNFLSELRRGLALHGLELEGPLDAG